MFTGLGGERLWLCPTLNNSAKDLSGNSNNGVIGNSVTTVADTSNGGTLAYNFPDTVGTNTITINGFDLGGLSQLTWSAWIYDESDNAAITHSSFFSWRKGGSGNDDILFFNYERSWLGFQLNNGADGQAAYTPVYYQNWKHYCVVFDGTNPTATDRLNLYVNGVLQTPDTTFSYPATTSNETGSPYAEIGDYVGNPNHGIFNFKGKQDDIRIYERAITQAEIAHLASSRGVQGGPYYKPLTLKSRVTRLLSNRVTLLERIRSASKPTTPISIKVKHNEEPSYKAGYAKNADESENPHLWDGLTGAWVPNLGIGSGLKIKNLAVKNDEGDLKNDIEWSQKGMIQNDADQYVLLPDGYVNTEGTVIGSIDPIGVYSHFRSHQVWNSRNWIVEISSVGGSGFIASCNKWGSSGYATVNSSSTQSDKSYTLASSFKDGDTLKLYVDGNLAGETAYSGSQTQAGWDAKIFRYSDAQPGQHNWANPYLYGPVLLYKRVLSASEIKTLSEDLLAPFRRKKSAIGYQPNKELKGLIRT